MLNRRGAGTATFDSFLEGCGPVAILPLGEEDSTLSGQQEVVPSPSLLPELGSTGLCPE